LNAKSKPSSNYTCGRCSRDKKVPQKFSAQNFMIPSSVPAELQNLTQIEEMLLARALPTMKVFTNVGGQRGYSGHCINLPQKVEELVQSLPRCPKDIPMIIVTMKGNDNNFRDVVVRKRKVEKALFWLIEHNPLYHDICIDRNTLDKLTCNGVPNDLRLIETPPNELNNINETIKSTDVNKDNDLEQVFNHETSTSSFLPKYK
jgi:hypothetical protein